MITLAEDVKFTVTLERKKLLKMRRFQQMHLTEQNLYSFSDKFLIKKLEYRGSDIKSYQVSER